MPRPNKPQWHAHSGRWRTRIDGKVHYFPRSIGRQDKPLRGGIPVAAWEYLDALVRRARGPENAGADPTVYWLVELYLAWAEGERDAGRLSAGQYAGQVSRLKLLLEHPGFSERKARSLTVDEVGEFFDSLKARGLSRHYVAGVGRTVRTVFRWGAKAVRGRTPTRLLAENPFSGYDFPRAPKSVRGYVDPKVTRRWLRWCWARARGQSGVVRRFDRLFCLMVQFQRLTGCRPGEACDLRWGDIDWSRRVATLPEDRHKTGHLTGKARVIHLTRPVLRLLRAVRNLEGGHPEFVFTHRRARGATLRGHDGATAGEPWPSGSAASAKVRQWRLEALALREAARARGEPDPFPGLEGAGPTKLVAYVAGRHAYVSEGVSAGLTHEQVARLVGNTPQVVGETYAHAIEGADAARAAGLVERGKTRGG